MTRFSPRRVCLLAVDLLALASEEMLRLQVGPLGLADDNSDGIMWTDLLLRADTST